MIYSNAHEAYLDLGNKLLSEGQESVPRGLKTKELINVNITIENPLDYLTPRTHLTYLFGELLWYRNADKFDLSMITAYAPFWDQIKNEDGSVNSNYGVYVFDYTYGIPNIVKTLIIDPLSRKAFINIGHPATINTKDTTCTLSLQFLLRNQRLDLIVTSRSVDISTGYPYDLAYFSIVQQIVVAVYNTLTLDKIFIGKYHHNIGSLHYYTDRQDELEKSLQKEKKTTLPPFNIEEEKEYMTAVRHEYLLRTRRVKQVDTTLFQSPFWKKCFDVLNKKFSDD